MKSLSIGVVSSSKSRYFLTSRTNLSICTALVDIRSVAVSSSDILCSRLLCSVSYSVIRRLNCLSGNRPSVKFSYRPFIRSSKSIIRRFASNNSFLSSVLSFSHCNSYCAFNCSTNSCSSLRTYCDTLLVA